MEALKTVLLIVLVLMSVGFSAVLLADEQQHEALPAWFTDVPETTGGPGEELTPQELTAAVLSPSRMIRHTPVRHDQYVPAGNDYAATLWETVSQSLVGDWAAAEVSAAEWAALTRSESFEFIFSGDYLLDFFLSDENGLRLDRLLLTAESAPRVLARSLVHDSIYEITFSEPILAELDISLITADDAEDGWQVYDAGVNEQIMDGVYLPHNFIDRYGKFFPEVLLTANTYPTADWLGLYFAEPDLVRDVTLEADSKYLYTLGQDQLILSYTAAPHMEYTYTPLPGDDAGSATPVSALEESAVFIARRNPANWPVFSRDVRLTSLAGQEGGRYDLSFETHVNSLAYSVPFASPYPAFEVVYSGGEVLSSRRQVWEFGRLNYLPRISIDAPEAIERLSLDRWKTDMDTNPYANFAISAFQSYLDSGYRIADVELVYYSEQGLASKQFVSPHWRITLADGAGSREQFLINAMTGYVPSAGFLEQE